MAGHDNGPGVGVIGVADRPCGQWAMHHLGDLCIGANFTVGNCAQCLPDVALEVGRVVVAEEKFELAPGAVKVFKQLGDRVSDGDWSGAPGSAPSLVGQVDAKDLLVVTFDSPCPNG